MSWWQVEAKVKELREVSAGDDSAAIKAKIEELQKEVMAIGQVRCCALLMPVSKPVSGSPNPRKGSLPFHGCHQRTLAAKLPVCIEGSRVVFQQQTANMGWD